MHRLVLLCVLAPAFLAAQSHPDFTGTWKLNVAESDFSDKRFVVPDRLVYTLRQKGDSMKFGMDSEARGRKNKWTIDLAIGGSPHVSDEAGIINAEWKGNKLVLDVLYNPDNERRSDQQQTWSLSDDGKKLIEDLVVHPPKSTLELRTKRVFDKQ
jgi:hypothetical protein